MRTLAKLLAFSLTVSAASQASAREWDLRFGTSAHVASAPSMDALSSHDTIALGDVSLAAKVTDAPFVDGLFAELHWQFGGVSAVDFGNIDSELGLQSLRGGVMGVRALNSHTRAFARGDVGVLAGSLSMSAMDANGQTSKIADREWAPCAYAGVGVELSPARNDAHGFHLALGVELGYLAAADLSFSAKPSYPNDGMAHITTAAAPIGSADASGWSFGFHIAGRW